VDNQVIQVIPTTQTWSRYGPKENTYLCSSHRQMNWKRLH